MKFSRFLVAASLLVLMAISTATAQTTRYWDVSGTSPGATNGDGIADGTWNTANARWNTDPTGGAAGTISGWTANDNAVFSAGSDVGNDLSVNGGVITVSAESVANTATFEEGAYRLEGTGLAAGQTIIKAGAHLEYNLRTVFAATAGKITIQGGELEFINPGHAGSFANATQTLEVDGSAIAIYDDASFRLGTATDCNCSIYTPTGTNAITGVGGTVNNGGAGTLIKRGVGELRYQGVGLPLTTYQKLRVEQGLFRLGFSASIQDERGYGAAPVTPLADAITLDGGYIAHSFNATSLHANRGVTIGPNGGGWAGGTVTIPASLSGTGTFHIIGGQVTLGNAANDTTFTGKHNIESGTLVVAGDSYLGAAPGAPVADQISLGGTSPQATIGATTGTLNFSASTTLNANRGITLAGSGPGRINIPTGGNTVTYGGSITGPGNLIKMGDGGLVLGGASTNSGTTDVYGRLIANNTSGSATGTGAVNVKSLSATLGTNGTLGGTGSIAGLVTVESGASLAPGATAGGIGALSLNGGLTLSSGSLLAIDLGPPTTGDLINVGGTTTINGGTINITNAGGLGNGTYTILDYAGALGGSAANLALGTTPAGFTFGINDTGSAITLSVTSAVVGVPGDYNNNNVVDAADYVVWRNGGPLQNEVSGVTPGTVTAEDYDAWKARFGNVSGSGSGLNAGGVPEPASVALVALCIASMLGASRRSR